MGNAPGVHLSGSKKGAKYRPTVQVVAAKKAQVEEESDERSEDPKKKLTGGIGARQGVCEVEDLESFAMSSVSHAASPAKVEIMAGIPATASRRRSEEPAVIEETTVSRVHKPSQPVYATSPKAAEPTRRMSDSARGYDSECDDDQYPSASAAKNETQPPECLLTSRLISGELSGIVGGRSASGSASNATARSDARSSTTLLNEMLSVLFELLPFYNQNNGAVDNLVRKTIASMNEHDCAAVDADGSTALIVCCQYAHADLATLLLNRGADVNATNAAGVTALSYACGARPLAPALVRLLLDNGADPNVTELHYGCAALHYLAGSGDFSLCDLLLKRGARADAQDWYEWTPADYATDAGFPDCADRLRKQAAIQAVAAKWRRSARGDDAFSSSGQGSSSSLRGSGVSPQDECRSEDPALSAKKAAELQAEVMVLRGQVEALEVDKRARKQRLEDQASDLKKMQNMLKSALNEAENYRSKLREVHEAKADLEPLVIELRARAEDAESRARLALEASPRSRPSLDSDEPLDGSLLIEAGGENVNTNGPISGNDGRCGSSAALQVALLQERERELLEAKAAAEKKATEAQAQCEERVLETQAARQREMEDFSSRLADARAKADSAVSDANRLANEARDRENLATRKLQATLAELACAKREIETSKAEATALADDVARAKVVEKRNEQLDKDLTREIQRRKVLHNQIEDMKGRIRVYVRLRPMSKREADRGCLQACARDGKDGVALTRADKKPPHDKQAFTFDRAFDQSDPQQAVFADVKSLVLSCVDGFNVCVFAYGQSGSGKTHTMLGVKSLDEAIDPATWTVDEGAGIVPRSAVEVFRVLEERAAQCDFFVDVSMYELYRDALRDLLAPPSKTKKAPNLDIKLAQFSASGLVEVDGAAVRPVKSISELVATLSDGIRSRSVAHTNLNAESSRSHLIVSLVLKTVNHRTGATVRGKLTLVDLAGSERVEKSGVTGDQLKEATSINKSLSAIGDVISSLASAGKHVPYRNHPLTMLLSDVIGGDSKTLLIINASPADYNVNETLNSLQFGTRCKTVKQQNRNEMANQLKDLKSELARIKASGATAKKPSTAQMQRPARGGGGASP